MGRLCTDGRTDWETDWRTDMTKLIAFFRNFARAPNDENCSHITNYPYSKERLFKVALNVENSLSLWISLAGPTFRSVLQPRTLPMKVTFGSRRAYCIKLILKAFPSSWHAHSLKVRVWFHSTYPQGILLHKLGSMQGSFVKITERDKDYKIFR
jgi:hypothetical protein